VTSPDVKQIATLLADLDSERFDTRDKATRQLEKMPGAHTALRERLQHQPTLEVRQRIEKILLKLDDLQWQKEQLRVMPAVRLLAQFGSSDAQRLLEALAEGPPEIPFVLEARAALRRLGNPGSKS
jgi:hypothetical protein